MLTDTCHIAINYVSKCQGSQSCIKGHKQRQVSYIFNLIEVTYVHSNGIKYTTRSIALSRRYIALRGRI